MSHLAGSNAQARGWGPGWPTNRSADMVDVNINGVTFPGGIHKGIAELFTLLCLETERRGYKLVKGWCWGYNNRNIDGTSTPSNHSWGLAGDINAPKNPYGSTLVTDMPSWMPNLWNEYGFGWGGDWSGKKDAMHYEFLGTPAEAAALTAKARDAFGEDDMTKEQKAKLNYSYQHAKGIDRFVKDVEEGISDRDLSKKSAGFKAGYKFAKRAYAQPK